LQQSNNYKIIIFYIHEEIYMTDGARNREGWLGASMVFSLVPGSSLVLRWMMLEKVLGVGALRRLAILG
jgi:hypothetical protein